MREAPHGKRRGWLKNGNPVGDLSGAPKCGAKNRQAQPCRRAAMRNGRCPMHGGLSTGPRTADDIGRIRQARTIHGFYSAAAIALRSAARVQARALRAWLQGMS